LIIGVVGTNAAGKDTAAQYLAEKLGWPVFSMSDELREIARSRGLTTERTTLQKLGNELREKYGGDYISKLILKKYSDDFIISSIRNPQEIEPLKYSERFVLLMIDADPKIRYERAKTRMRSIEDSQTFEEFIKAERYELEGSGHELCLKPVFEAADVIISNDGTRGELLGKLNEFMEEVKNEQVELG